MREVFVPREAEDESGLTPGEDDNEAWCQKHRKTIDNWMGDWYEFFSRTSILCFRMIRAVYIARFGEALRRCQEKLDSRNFYAFNPAFSGKRK